MKSLTSLLIFAVSVITLLFAALCSASTPKENADIFPRWTVVGEWHVNHPEWTEDLVFAADGNFAIKGKDLKSGTWVLTAEGGTPLLVLRWDRYATESLQMVGIEHFRGQTRPGRWIDMRRIATSKTNGKDKEVQKP